MCIRHCEISNSSPVFVLFELWAILAPPPGFLVVVLRFVLSVSYQKTCTNMDEIDEGCGPSCGDSMGSSTQYPAATVCFFYHRPWTVCQSTGPGAADCGVTSKLGGAVWCCIGEGGMPLGWVRERTPWCSKRTGQGERDNHVI